MASQGSCVVYFLSHSVWQSNQSTSSLLPSVLKTKFPSECFVISQEYCGWQVTQNLSTHQFKQIGVYFDCITKSWRSLRAFCLSALPSLALWFVTSWPQESCCGSGDSDYIPGRMKGGKNEASLTHWVWPFLSSKWSHPQDLSPSYPSQLPWLEFCQVATLSWKGDREMEYSVSSASVVNLQERGLRMCGSAELRCVTVGCQCWQGRVNF